MEGLEFNEPAFFTLSDAQDWSEDARRRGWKITGIHRGVKRNGTDFWWVQARRNKSEQKAVKAQKKSG